MGTFIAIEASQSGGSWCYRLEMGCFVHPRLASILIVLTRLF
jgi:hypothetical protein